MAYPASTALLGKDFDQASLSMGAVKSTAQKLSDDSAAGPTNRVRYVKLMRDLNTLDGVLARVQGYGQAAVDYALAQYPGLAGLDPAAEFTAVRAATQALSSWISTAIPDGSSITEYSQAQGDVIDLTYTTAQTSGFRTNAAAFIATIA